MVKYSDRHIITYDYSYGVNKFGHMLTKMIYYDGYFVTHGYFTDSEISNFDNVLTKGTYSDGYFVTYDNFTYSDSSKFGLS